MISLILLNAGITSTNNIENLYEVSEWDRAIILALAQIPGKSSQAVSSPL